MVSKIPTIRAKSVDPDAAKIPHLKSKLPVFGYKPDNSLAVEIQQQKQKERLAEFTELEARQKINTDASIQREASINEIFSKIDKKLDSAKQKFNPSFRASKPTSEFKVVESVPQKTPSTAAKSQRSATVERTPSTAAAQ